MTTIASFPLTVQFKAPIDPASLSATYELHTVMEKALTRAKWIRHAVLVLSVIGFAWSTQALGFSMASAFCVLLGWLPVAWGGLWLLTTLMVLPRQAAKLALINSTLRERTFTDVTLKADDKALHFAWSGGSEDVPWGEVIRTVHASPGLVVLTRARKGWAIDLEALGGPQQAGQLLLLFEEARRAGSR